MVENQFFYQWGLVIGCKKKWAEKHKARQVKVTKKRGVCFGIQWEIGDGRRGYFVIFHLDAAKESKRIAQLEEMGEWVTQDVAENDIVMYLSLIHI